MPAARLLRQRLRRLVPEAFAFGVIGALNSVLYFVIFNATMRIGAVKATIIATVVTTTLSYLANRHWTYKHRPRSALRREYTLFFAFNFAGLVIQTGAVTFAKYGLGYTESKNWLAFNLVTLVGVAVATVFRFWAYRTFVFLKSPPAAARASVAAGAPIDPSDGPLDGHALAHLDPAAELAEVVTEHHRAAGKVPAQQPRADGLDAQSLDAELAAEVDAARRPAGR